MGKGRGGRKRRNAKCTACTRARTSFGLINGTANLIRMVAPGFNIRCNFQQKLFVEPARKFGLIIRFPKSQKFALPRTDAKRGKATLV